MHKPLDTRLRAHRATCQAIIHEMERLAYRGGDSLLVREARRCAHAARQARRLGFPTVGRHFEEQAESFLREARATRIRRQSELRSASPARA